MLTLARFLVTLWAGSLWTICGLAAPTSFAVLGRATAGMLVGWFFALAAWLGFAIAVVLLVLARVGDLAALRAATTWIAITAAAPVASELVLGPLMHQARVAGEMQRFALLHGLSAVLFLTACVGAAVLVVRISREG